MPYDYNLSQKRHKMPIRFGAIADKGQVQRRVAVTCDGRRGRIAYLHFDAKTLDANVPAVVAAKGSPRLFLDPTSLEARSLRVLEKILNNPAQQPSCRRAVAHAAVKATVASALTSLSGLGALVGVAGKFALYTLGLPVLAMVGLWGATLQTRYLRRELAHDQNILEGLRLGMRLQFGADYSLDAVAAHRFCRKNNNASPALILLCDELASLIIEGREALYARVPATGIA